MRPDQIIALVLFGVVALFLAAWLLQIATDERANRRDMERLREADREWAAAVARWFAAPPR